MTGKIAVDTQRPGLGAAAADVMLTLRPAASMAIVVVFAVVAAPHGTPSTWITPAKGRGSLVRIAGTAPVAVKAATAVKLTLKASAKVRARLRRLRSLRATLRLTGTDLTGNAVTLARSSTLR